VNGTHWSVLGEMLEAGGGDLPEMSIRLDVQDMDPRVDYRSHFIPVASRGDPLT